MAHSRISTIGLSARAGQARCGQPTRQGTGGTRPHDRLQARTSQASGGLNLRAIYSTGRVRSWGGVPRLHVQCPDMKCSCVRVFANNPNRDERQPRLAPLLSTWPLYFRHAQASSSPPHPNKRTNNHHSKGGKTGPGYQHVNAGLLSLSANAPFLFQLPAVEAKGHRGEGANGEAVGFEAQHRPRLHFAMPFSSPGRPWRRGRGRSRNM